MNGTYYASIVRRTYKTAFKKTLNPKAKRVLVDGDPSQNSKLARKALTSIGAIPFSIPPRSPDLNPIENLFAQVRSHLRKQAQQGRIFTLRVQQLLESFSVAAIDKIIESMPRRVDMILKRRGQRLKY